MSFRETARHYELVLESIFEPQPRNPQKERKQNVKNFDEIITDQTKTAVKIPQSDYLKSGKYRIFDQGKEYSAGFSNEEIGAVKDFPYIIFGDHTRAVKFVNEPCFIGADGVKLLKVTNASFDAKYIYYNILAKPIESHGYTRHFKFLKEIKFTEKTLSEQKKIVTHLDRIQNAIDTKKNQLVQLDELAKSKFVKMFGENPAESGKWLVKPLNRISDVRDGTHGSPAYYPKGYPFITTKNFVDGTIDYSTASFICEEDYRHFDKRSHVDNGDILLPMIGTIGGAILVKKECDFAIKNVALIKHENENLNFKYLLNVLNSDFMNAYFLQFRSGGTQKFISLNFIRNLSIPVPPLALQVQFASYVQKIDSAKDIVKSQLKDLRELLDNKMDFYFGE